jgi:hypothetical protein
MRVPSGKVVEYIGVGTGLAFTGEYVAAAAGAVPTSSFLSSALALGLPRLSAGRFVSSGSCGAEAVLVAAGGVVVEDVVEEEGVVGDELELDDDPVVVDGEGEGGGLFGGAFNEGRDPTEVGVPESEEPEFAGFETVGAELGFFESEVLESDVSVFFSPLRRKTGRASASSFEALVAAGAFFFAAAA